MVAMFQERLPTLNIPCVKNDKRGQTNCNEFRDDFVMKNDRRTKPNCLLCYVQPS